MNNTELNYAYKVRHALNESAENLPPSITEKLASARKTAVSRKRKDAPLAYFIPRQVLAGDAGGFFRSPVSWLHRMGLAIPLIVLAAGLIGLYEFENERRISDTAEIDAAVLVDDLPLSAYVDYGFNAYLAERDD